MGENGRRRPYTVIDESDSATAGLARLSVLRFWLSLTLPRSTQPPTQADMTCHRSFLVGSVVVLYITCVEPHCPEIAGDEEVQDLARAILRHLHFCDRGQPICSCSCVNPRGMLSLCILEFHGTDDVFEGEYLPDAARRGCPPCPLSCSQRCCSRGSEGIFQGSPRRGSRKR